MYSWEPRRNGARNGDKRRNTFTFFTSLCCRNRAVCALTVRTLGSRRISNSSSLYSIFFHLFCSSLLLFCFTSCKVHHFMTRSVRCNSAELNFKSHYTLRAHTAPKRWNVHSISWTSTCITPYFCGHSWCSFLSAENTHTMYPDVCVREPIIARSKISCSFKLTGAAQKACPHLLGRLRCVWTKRTKTKTIKITNLRVCLSLSRTLSQTCICSSVHMLGMFTEPHAQLTFMARTTKNKTKIFLIVSKFFEIYYNSHNTTQHRRQRVRTSQQTIKMFE